MILLTKLRQERGLSKLQLSFDARVPAQVLGQVESGRFAPYPPQLQRLAAALDFDGDPAELLKLVTDEG